MFLITPTILVISGSRTFRPHHIPLAERILMRLPRTVIIRHGDQGVVQDDVIMSGCDKLVGKLAEGLGFTVEAWPADWNRYGASAGPRRNAEMLRGNSSRVPADALLAFWNGASTGTEGTIKLARQMKLPTWVVDIK